MANEIVCNKYWLETKEMYERMDMPMAKIKAADMLSKMTDDELYALIDSGVANDIIKGYMELAIKHKGVGGIMDNYNSQKARDYWYNN